MCCYRFIVDISFTIRSVPSNQRVFLLLLNDLMGCALTETASPCRQSGLQKGGPTLSILYQNLKAWYNVLKQAILKLRALDPPFDKAARMHETAGTPCVGDMHNSVPASLHASPCVDVRVIVISKNHIRTSDIACLFSSSNTPIFSPLILPTTKQIF